eukprot:30938-Pelagococcus_subviridis.AAC.3
MRREKSLRIGVHHANAAVWGPVYRTHPSSRLAFAAAAAIASRCAAAARAAAAFFVSFVSVRFNFARRFSSSARALASDASFAFRSLSAASLRAAFAAGPYLGTSGDAATAAAFSLRRFGSVNDEGTERRTNGRATRGGKTIEAPVRFSLGCGRFFRGPVDDDDAHLARARPVVLAGFAAPSRASEPGLATPANARAGWAGGGTSETRGEGGARDPRGRGGDANCERRRRDARRGRRRRRVATGTAIARAHFSSLIVFKYFSRQS